MIPKNKILIVSGEPRSGTSLMMQTLKHLGIDVAGQVNPSERRLERQRQQLKDNGLSEERVDKRIQRSQLLNPGGFYEIGGVVSRGISGPTMSDYFGKALKIITNGIQRTDMRHVCKMILCIRNPKNIAVSQKKLVGGIEVMDVDDPDRWLYVQEAFEPSPLMYLRGTGNFIMWLSQNEEWSNKILVVDYEDMILNTELQINRIIEFINIEDISEQRSAALGNVDKNLSRSQEFSEWSDEHKESGMLAMELYESLKTMDIVEITAKLLDVRAQSELESVSWVDDDSEFGTWLFCHPATWRSLKTNNKGLRDKLLRSRKNRELLRSQSYHCTHYSRDGETYVVSRPPDVGDLIRSKVSCERDKDEKTLEECMSCWRDGWRGSSPQRESN